MRQEQVSLIRERLRKFLLHWHTLSIGFKRKRFRRIFGRMYWDKLNWHQERLFLAFSAKIA